MVMSMTGYGNDSFHYKDVTITIEIRSVNSRYLDFIPKIPRSLLQLELEFKKIIQTYFQRGRIELFISTTGSILEEKKLSVDWHLIDEFMEQLTAFKNRYQLQGEIPLSVITTIDELFMIKEEKQNDDQLHQLILASVERVAKQVLSNRKREGTFLMNDINERFENLANKVQQIAERKEIVYDEYNARIKKRIESHLNETITVDQGQLLQEIALLAEKSDITEETTRLYSHLEHFTQVARQQSPIGKKLDFITQEILRETNTIGAKSVDPLISEWVVQIKSNLEKIKEQIQNIE